MEDHSFLRVIGRCTSLHVWDPHKFIYYSTIISGTTFLVTTIHSRYLRFYLPFLLSIPRSSAFHVSSHPFPCRTFLVLSEPVKDAHVRVGLRIWKWLFLFHEPVQGSMQSSNNSANQVVIRILKIDDFLSSFSNTKDLTSFEETTSSLGGTTTSDFLRWDSQWVMESSLPENETSRGKDVYVNTVDYLMRSSVITGGDHSISEAVSSSSYHGAEMSNPQPE